MFRINFNLKEADKIIPWGSGKSPVLHWFGLTDGLLWINVNESVIYEYSDTAVAVYDGCSRYNEYQLARFLEDFSEIFINIRESVPLELYEAAERFFKITDGWKSMYIDKPDEIFDNFYDNKYCPITEWLDLRTINSGHLIGGPNIRFIRCGDMLKIIWDGRYMLENGDSLWKYPCGAYEMKYDDFASEANRFFTAFFEAMDRQVRFSCEKDWGTVQLDKKRLAEENIQRRLCFEQCLSYLEDDVQTSDWDSILSLFADMCNETGGVCR